MAIIKNLQYFFFINLVLLFLVGCAKREEIKDVKEYVARIKQNAQASRAPKKIVVDFHLPFPVTYQNAVRKVEPQAINQKTAILHPLQAYPLQAYQFLGTLAQDKQIWAYVKSPTNLIFQVKKGDILGDHYGRITNIEQDSMQIELEDKLANKQTTQRIIILQLKEQR